MPKNNLLSIYGARLSKNGDYINLTLVCGEGKEKQFYTACVKVDETAKTHGRIKGEEAHIVVPLLKDQRATEVDENVNDDLPF